jgi:hypothetical protein
MTFDVINGTRAGRLAAPARLPAKLLSPLIGRLDDELVELVRGTVLGRILVRVPGVGAPGIGYFALRQPAA